MGLLFAKKRNDGKLVKDEDSLIRIMPYIMRGRNESVIYFARSYDVEAIQEFIRDKRAEGKRITLFNIIVAAMLQTIYRRPKINRFVAGRRLYEHNDISILYAVKTRMTDDALESIAKVKLNPSDTIYDVAERMQNNINMIKDDQLKTDDKLIRFVVKLPRSFLQFALWIVRLMDFYGIMPKALMEATPLYSSMYISHLGSVGADAPFHHLYEFGTTSIFITIGRVYDAPYKGKDNQVEWRQTVDLKFSIDERICDGFYLIKSLKVFDKFMQNPADLEHSPLFHEQEYKQLMAEIRQRKETREAREAREKSD